MRRWLMALAGGYAGAGAMTFLMYRAAYRRTLPLRAWAEQNGAELTGLLEQLRAELRELVERKRLVGHPPADEAGKTPAPPPAGVKAALL